MLPEPLGQQEPQLLSGVMVRAAGFLQELLGAAPFPVSSLNTMVDTEGHLNFLHSARHPPMPFLPYKSTPLTAQESGPQTMISNTKHLPLPHPLRK